MLIDTFAVTMTPMSELMGETVPALQTLPYTPVKEAIKWSMSAVEGSFGSQISADVGSSVLAQVEQRRSRHGVDL